jgi:hypothetical protein
VYFLFLSCYLGQSSFVSEDAPSSKPLSPQAAQQPPPSFSEVEIRQLITDHIDSLREEIAVERKARDKEEIRRTKQLLESVSKTINVVIPERVDQVPIEFGSWKIFHILSGCEQGCRWRYFQIRYSHIGATSFRRGSATRSGID